MKMDDIESILEVLEDKAEGEDGMAYGYMQVDDDVGHGIYRARAEVLRELIAELKAARMPTGSEAGSADATDHRCLVITEVSGPYRATVHLEGDDQAEVQRFEARHAELREKCLVKYESDRVSLPSRPASAGPSPTVDVRWVYIEDTYGRLRGSIHNERSEVEALKAQFDEEEDALIQACEAWSTWHAVLVPHRRG